MQKTAVAIGIAEVLGAVGLVITTLTIPTFADMAPAWRVLAVFMAVEGGNRLYNNVSV